MPARERVPLKARLPWFQVWVPLLLLLYLLVNGAGHVAALGKLNLIPTRSFLALMERLRVDVLWSAWAFLIYPCLIILAVATWKLAPWFSTGVRWASGMAGAFLLCLFLLAHGWLFQGPFGWPPALGILPAQRRILAYLWKPHLSHPGLEPSARDIAGFLGDPEEDVSRKAAQALAELDAKELAPDIAKLLGNPEKGVRRSAAWVLGKLGAREFAPQIARLLGDPDEDVRECAAEALGNMDAREFTPQIAKLLDDPDWLARANAVEALGNMDAREFTPQIAKLLGDPDRDVRESAALALGRLGAREFAPQIARLLHDPEEDVRECAAEALGKLGAKEHAPDIAKLLSDPDKGVRDVAASVLQQLGVPAPKP